MWFNKRNMLLRLSMLVVMVLVCSIASNNGYSHAPSIFGYPKNLVVLNNCNEPL